MSFLDFSGVKPDLRAVIPAGTKLFVRFNYAPGGADLPGTPTDKREGALTKSKPTAENPNPDGYYLKGEFTVLRGPYKGRKFWSNMVVAGGKLDEHGNSKAGKITRENLRLMIDSANGLASTDESPEAAAKRVLSKFAQLQNLTFVCKAKVEPAQGGYPEKNALGQVLTIDHKDFPKSPEELDNPPNVQAAATPTPAGFGGGAASNPFANAAQGTGSNPFATASAAPAAPASPPVAPAATPDAPATDATTSAQQPAGAGDASGSQSGLPSWMTKQAA